MNNEIEKKQREIDALRDLISEYEEIIKENYNKILDDMVLVKIIVNNLENSTCYQWEEYGDYVAQVIRIDNFIDTELRSSLLFPHLCEYLEENYCILSEYLGEEYEVFSLNLGPNIIINEDGDIIDQDTGKFFLLNKDYSSKEERNREIEEYMKETGVFPGVFYSDRYGQLTHIDTQGSK